MSGTGTPSARPSRDAGFSLVELLVVTLILGLLAAIAIPAFFSQEEKARDADAKSAVRTARSAIEVYASEHDGSYAGATAAELVDIEGSLSDQSLSVTSAGKTYTVAVRNVDTGNEYRISVKPESPPEFSCSVAGRGGCGPGGEWGR